MNIMMYIILRHLTMKTTTKLGQQNTTSELGKYLNNYIYTHTNLKQAVTKRLITMIIKHYSLIKRASSGGGEAFPPHIIASTPIKKQKGERKGGREGGRGRGGGGGGGGRERERERERERARASRRGTVRGKLD